MTGKRYNELIYEKSFIHITNFTLTPLGGKRA